MRNILILGLAVVLAAPANAQLADSLSRGQQPNAIDRTLKTTPAPDYGAQATADQQRSDQAARDAAARLGPVQGSTMTDGPTGVQRSGSGTGDTAAPPASPSPAPITPQS